MQRKNVVFRKIVVHYGEHHLLNTAKIGRAVNNTDITVEIHRDNHIGCFTVRKSSELSLIFRLVELVIRKSNESELSVLEDTFFHIFRNRAEHIVNENRGESLVSNCSYRQSVSRIGTENPVINIKTLFLFQSSDRIFKDHVKDLRIDRTVVR